MLNQAKQNAAEYIRQNADVFQSVSDYIWQNPELSLQEFKATQRFCAELRNEGFTVTENLCGISTAFCGSWGSGRPVIGILGEYDALSGLSQVQGITHQQSIVPGGSGHGCGHNMLGAGALGAAFAVKHYLQEANRPGTVIFFGCPGEEGGSGKAFMARENEWAKLDAAITWHPGDVNMVHSGTNNSSIQVIYRFKGIASHAASAPEDGRSALDAAELMNVGVQFLREHMSSECRVHYSFVDNGGISPNVVQPTAAVLYMVRANKVRDSIKLLARVDKIAQGAALMTETTMERQFIDGTAELLPNYTLERVMQNNLEAVPQPAFTAEERSFAAALKATYTTEAQPGVLSDSTDEEKEWLQEHTQNGTRPLNDFVVPLHSTTAFAAGSTDVGDVSWQTPTVQCYAVTFPSGVPGHSWQNVSCGGSSIGEKGMLYAAQVMAATAIDLFEQPEVLQKAREEFARRSKAGYVCPIEKNAVPTVVE